MVLDDTMNQPEPFFFPNTSNRSPGSSRSAYNTTTGHPSTNRLTQQRQLDPLSQPPMTLYSEERFASLSNDYRHARLQSPQGYHDSSLMANNQAWAHNSGANTINGALGDASRLRPPARRQIPTEWMTVNDPGPGSQNLFPPASTQFGAAGHFSSPMNMMNGVAGLAMDRHVYPNSFESIAARQATPRQLERSDLIPTAIVIKNIPFNVRKEQLAALMVDLNLPTPYAFNYHFDNGVFRGLAFANFQSPEDTYQVIEALNGYEVQGRKLRVEYKKMLPEAERERIEREKREKRGQLEEQHQPMNLQQQSSLHSLNASMAGDSRTVAPRELPDYNDDETRSFFTELTLFQSDPAREIIVFPSTMTSIQRRKIHTLAHHMGLQHRSMGEGANRQLHVIKDIGVSPTATTSIQPPTGVSLELHRRGLSRAATIDFAETRNPPGQFGTTVGRSGVRPMLELPDNAELGLNGPLRGVKSFADLRSFTPSPSPSVGFVQNNARLGSTIVHFGQYSNSIKGQTNTLGTPTTPGAGAGGDTSVLIPSITSMSLADPFPSTTQHRPQQTPGAIGSQRPGMSTTTSRTAPERQPIGPVASDRSDFASGWRGRQNGHMQRDSDSSDNGVRGANSSNTSRFN